MPLQTMAKYISLCIMCMLFQYASCVWSIGSCQQSGTLQNLSINWKTTGHNKTLYEYLNSDTIKILFGTLVRPHASALQQCGLDCKKYVHHRRNATVNEPVTIMSSATEWYCRNGLPLCVITSPSLNYFKATLDSCWNSHHYN